MKTIIALATLSLLLFLPTISMAQEAEGPATTVVLGAGENNTAHFATLSSSYTSDFYARLKGKTETGGYSVLTGKISNGGPDECELTVISLYTTWTVSTDRNWDNLTLPSGTWDAYIHELRGNWRSTSYYYVEAKGAPATGTGSD